MHYWFTIFISLFTFSAAIATDVFSWTDEKGVVHYGDEPPEQSQAHRVHLPELTIVKDYGKLYKPVLTAEERGIKPKKQSKSVYEKFEILAPKDKQAIRANDGDVTVMLALKPKLFPDHSLGVYLDGKQMAEGGLRMVNLTNLDRGEHKIYALVKDKKGKEVSKSKIITFSVLR